MSHLGGILYGLAFGVAFLLLPRVAQWRWAVSALPFMLFVSQFYSPWQLEWRLVNSISSRVTSNAECQMPSIEPEVYRPVDITVVNASTRRIALFWINYDGNPEAYFWLRPGSSDEYNLFMDHRWCIVDADTGKLLEVVILKQRQTITIR